MFIAFLCVSCYYQSMEEEKHMEKMLKIFKTFFEKSLLMDLGKEPTYNLQEEETVKLLEYIDTF